VVVEQQQRGLLHATFRVRQAQVAVVLDLLAVAERDRAGAVVEVQERRAVHGPVRAHGRESLGGQRVREGVFVHAVGLGGIVIERHGVVGLPRDPRVAPRSAERPAEGGQALAELQGAFLAQHRLRLEAHEPAAQEHGLHLVHTVVMAVAVPGHQVVVQALAGVLGHPAHLLEREDGLVDLQAVRRHRPAFAARQHLALLEREAARVAERACALAAPSAAVLVRHVFHDLELVLPRDPPQRVHIAHAAVEVHGDDRAGPARDGLLNRRGVHDERLRVDVDEYHVGADVHGRLGRGTPGHARNDHLMAGLHAQGLQRALHGHGAVGESHGVARADEPAVLLAEGPLVRPEPAPLAAADHLGHPGDLPGTRDRPLGGRESDRLLASERRQLCRASHGQPSAFPSGFSRAGARGERPTGRAEHRRGLGGKNERRGAEMVGAASAILSARCRPVPIWETRSTEPSRASACSFCS
jgi:hypothetical protein